MSAFSGTGGSLTGLVPSDDCAFLFFSKASLAASFLILYRLRLFALEHSRQMDL
jgi:hypothetical protein